MLKSTTGISITIRFLIGVDSFSVDHLRYANGRIRDVGNVGVAGGEGAGSPLRLGEFREFGGDFGEEVAGGLQFVGQFGGENLRRGEGTGAATSGELVEIVSRGGPFVPVIPP